MNKLISIIKEVLDTAFFVIIMLIIIKFFFFELRWIPSTSMVPTLQIKDRLVVERYSRFYTTPKRGQIMVFYPPDVTLPTDAWSLFARYTGILCKDIAYIKRVIGIPGDKLEIKISPTTGEYAVFINDKQIDEPYVNEGSYTPCDENTFCGSMTIPEGQYFMMGDNRGNSADSRFWGLLPQDRFIGRAVYLFWPIPRSHIFYTPQYEGIPSRPE